MAEYRIKKNRTNISKNNGANDSLFNIKGEKKKKALPKSILKYEIMGKENNKPRTINIIISLVASMPTVRGA